MKKTHGKTIGHVTIWIGQTENDELILVLNSIQVHRRYEKYGQEIRDLIFIYVAEFSQKLGIKKFVLGQGYNAVPVQILREIDDAWQDNQPNKNYFIRPLNSIGEERPTVDLIDLQIKIISPTFFEELYSDIYVDSWVRTEDMFNENASVWDISLFLKQAVHLSFKDLNTTAPSVIKDYEIWIIDNPQLKSIKLCNVQGNHLILIGKSYWDIHGGNSLAKVYQELQSAQQLPKYLIIGQNTISANYNKETKNIDNYSKLENPLEGNVYNSSEANNFPLITSYDTQTLEIKGDLTESSSFISNFNENTLLNEILDKDLSADQISVIGQALLNEYFCNDVVKFIPSVSYHADPSQYGSFINTINRIENEQNERKDSSPSFFVMALNLSSDPVETRGVGNHWVYALIRLNSNSNVGMCLLINPLSNTSYRPFLENASRQISNTFNFPKENGKVFDLGVQNDDFNCGIWILVLFQATLQIIHNDMKEFTNFSVETTFTTLSNLILLNNTVSSDKYIKQKRNEFNKIYCDALADVPNNNLEKARKNQPIVQMALNKVESQFKQRLFKRPAYPQLLATFGVRKNKATGPRVAKALAVIGETYGHMIALEIADKFCEWMEFHRRHFNMRDIHALRAQYKLEIPDDLPPLEKNILQ